MRNDVVSKVIRRVHAIQIKKTEPYKLKIDGRQRHFDVAVVGAGFAGAMAAVQIRRHSNIPMRILLVDKSGTFGRGSAYRASVEQHRLNVPAGNMGAFPDAVADFAKQFRLSDPSFALRALYGEYISGLLEATDCAIDRLSDEVVDIYRDGDRFVIISAAGDAFEAELVVLALGNFQPSHHVPDALGRGKGRYYVDDPLNGKVLDAVGHDGADVLVVGSGLTALDCILSLERRLSGKVIHVTSRRGLLSQPHAPQSASLTSPPELPFCRSALEMFRCVRKAIREQGARGVDWRPVIESLRPITHELWSQLDLREQRRFLRHVRPFWETHRHRSPPEVLASVQRLIEAGRVRKHAGRIVGAQELGQGLGLRVHIFDRRRQVPVTIDVSHVLNCTGPESDYTRVESRLARNLLSRGLIAAHPTALGLDATTDGCVIGRDAKVVPNLFTIGSPLKGVLYETTAVPEIRVQARDLGARCSRILKERAGAAYQTTITNARERR